MPPCDERLRHEGEGILLIYDNALDAEALKPYLPPGGAARVLVTSNAHAWRGVAAPVEIRLWPKEIGADYLVARTGRAAERAGAEALVGSARRPSARPRAGRRLLRAARNPARRVSAALRRGAGTNARHARAMRPPSITTG